MRKRLRIALGILLILLLACVTWALLQPGEVEPVYQGKRLGQWLDEYFIRFGYANSEKVMWDPQATNEAVNNAVRAIGTNAIPVLLNRLAARDSIIYRAKTFADKCGLHFLKPRSVPAGEEHFRAVMAFNALGTNAAGAVPQLMEMLRQVKNRKDDSRRIIVWVLGNIGPAASNSVPVLLETLTMDPVWKTHIESIYALGRIHSKPESVIPVMLTLLKTNDMQVRMATLECLSAFGAEAQTAVPSVLSLLTNESPGVRLQATNTLRAIDPSVSVKLGIQRSY